MPLHRFLRGMGCETQNDIEGSRAVGVPFGEETITDLLLARLAQSPNRTIHVRKYTRREEGKVGADFLLVVISDSPEGRVELSMLVQAKILYPDGTFGALMKATNAHPQTRNLLETAAKFGLVPMFAFYNAAPAPRPKWATPALSGVCPHIGQPCPHRFMYDRDEGDLGVALARANLVHVWVNAFGNKPKFADLAPVMWPLPCLVFCHCVAKGGGYYPGEPGPDFEVEEQLGQPSLVERVRSCLVYEGGELPVETRPVSEWLEGILDDRAERSDEFIRRQLEEMGVAAVVVATDVAVGEQE